jgi:hypothetical protein
MFLTGQWVECWSYDHFLAEKNILKPGLITAIYEGYNIQDKSFHQFPFAFR